MINITRKNIFNRKVKVLVVSTLLISGSIYTISDKVALLKAEKAIKKETSIIVPEVVKVEDTIKDQLSTTVEVKRTIPKIKPIVFNPNNVTLKSNITYEQLYNVLKNTGMGDVTEALIESEKEYGVNAIFLTSLVALESGWGKSNRATNGSNNMTGMAVYNNSSKGTHYSSRSASVKDLARQLSEYYLTKDAMYYNGLSIKDINIKYCAKSNWSSQITEIGEDIMYDLKKEDNKNDKE